MWTGRLSSSFVFDGKPVEVETSVHPDRDLLIVRVRSTLLADGRLGFNLRFPGVAAKLNPDPADWQHPETHSTQEISRSAGGLTLARQLDDTRYSVRVAADRELDIAAPATHAYRLTAPGSAQITLLVEFSAGPPPAQMPVAELARDTVAAGWEKFWTHGGVVDLTGSRDPRARELERRIVLSQYLTAVNSAGSSPPQEEGLFSNSWNGKFHLEMHAWHAAHFAVWGRPELLERSMPFYFNQLPAAKARARAHKVRGAWWPKMTGPEGRESPSKVNPFIMWQQPHPIYLAETIYKARPTRETLEKYRELVFETAELLASWPFYDRKAERFVLGPPLIPAQENFEPLETWNPTFELEYWRFGLATAQEWRERLGMPKDPNWDNVLFRLSKLPVKDGIYLAAESQQDLWERARSPECSKGNTKPECPNRDHPSFVAALGLLPGWGADRETMRRTLNAVIKDWDLRQTWGWDWPMLAMTATRLDEPEKAVDFLLWDAKNFNFGSVRHDAARASRSERGRARWATRSTRRSRLSPRGRNLFPVEWIAVVGRRAHGRRRQRRARAESRVSAERAVDRAQRRHPPAALRIIMISKSIGLALAIVCVVGVGCSNNFIEADQCVLVDLKHDDGPKLFAYLDAFAQAHGMTSDKSMPAVYMYALRKDYQKVALRGTSSPAMNTAQSWPCFASIRSVAAKCRLPSGSSWIAKSSRDLGSGAARMSRTMRR